MVVGLPVEEDHFTVVPSAVRLLYESEAGQELLFIFHPDATFIKNYLYISQV